MPKLLQINPVVKYGSTGRIAEQIGVIAKSKGWDSYIAYRGRPKNTSQSVLIQIGNKYDAFWHAVLTRLFDKHGLGSRLSTKLFVRKIKRINPDVIHLHDLVGYFINYKVLFKYLSESNIPVVWTFHCFWAMTGHCTYFSDFNCLKWKTICHKCPKKKYYPESIFVDSSSSNYKLKRKYFTRVKNLTIVTVSKWVEGLVKESFFFNYRIMTIYNGIDLKTFYPVSGNDILKAKLNITGKFVLLGLATTWGKRKGWDDYLKLSKLLSEDYIIILVGLNSQEMKAIPKNIIGIQRTQSLEELVSFYSMADIVMNLSYQETFGLTTAEGFACGTPGIVYNSTASPELISKDTGIIVEPGNINEVIAAIEEIRSNGKNYYSAKCRRRAEQLFSMEVRYNDYIKLYEELLLQRQS